jgi:hypothetical protein
VTPLKTTEEQIRGSVAESGTFTFLPSTVTYDDTLEYEITKVEATRVEAPRGETPVVEAPRIEAPKLKKEVGRRLEAETLEIPIKELRKTKEESNSRLVTGSKQEVPRRLEAETLEIPIKELRKTKEELNSRLVAGSKQEVPRRLEAETLEVPIKELRKTKEELHSRLVAGSKQEVPRLTSSITRPFRDSGGSSFDSNKLYAAQAAQQLGVSTPKSLLAKSATRQADIRPAKVLAKTTPGEPERKNKERAHGDLDKKEQVLFNR